MKKNVLLTIAAMLQFGIAFSQMPKTASTDPVYPTSNGPVTILLNTKNWPAIDVANMGIYSGLITTESSDNTGSWKNVVPAAWSDHPDSLKMTQVNDSIYSFTINNIAKFYGVAEGVGVMRITFIARDQSGHQTENLYFEVYDNSPVEAFTSTPALASAGSIVAVTLNVNKAGKTLKNYLRANPKDTVYAYSGVTTNLGGWQHQITGWGDVAGNSKLMCNQINDSIYRWYIQPSPNVLYGVTNPAEAIKGLNIVFRSKAGNDQAEDAYIELAYKAPEIISQVDSFLIYPKYPTATDKVFIYLNANKYKFNPQSALSAYTGLITSESADIKDDWKHQVKEWSDMSLNLTRMNDSVHVFEISSIKELYNVDLKKEDIFRIAFIARDSANGGVKSQTSNLYFEVFGSQPNAFISTQPKKPLEKKGTVVTVNIKQSEKKDLANSIDTMAVKEVYAYTALNTGWSHQVAAWGDVPTTAKLKCISASDSIYRFYILPNARKFYGVTDTCEHVYTANIVFRNTVAQTTDAFIQFDTLSYVKCEPSAVASLSNEVGVSVFPNPTSDYVNVKAANSIKEVRIFNTVGQQMSQLLNINNENTSLSIGNLENGVYFISIKTTDNVIVTQKLMKR